MASIVKLTDKRTGVTYVYESESYWDKEKKQPRSRRKLIGKIDPETNEIVPTGPRGRKKGAVTEPESKGHPGESELALLLEDKNRQIRELKEENRDLRKRNADILKKLSDILNSYGG